MSSSPSHTRSPAREATPNFLDDDFWFTFLDAGDEGASERATIGSMATEPTPGLVPTEDKLNDEDVRKAYRQRLLESIGYAPTRDPRIVIRWPARR